MTGSENNDLYKMVCNPNEKDWLAYLKENMTKRHVSCYCRDNKGKLIRYDSNCNKDFIHKEVDKDWEQIESQIAFSCFDFVSMSIKTIYLNKILWDEINGFYSKATEEDKIEIENCQNTLQLISDSWYRTVTKIRKPNSINLEPYKICKRSEKNIMKKVKQFSLNYFEVQRQDKPFLFDDVIGDIHYKMIIPAKYIKEHAKEFLNPKTGSIYSLIFEKDILEYIQMSQEMIKE